MASNAALESNDNDNQQTFDAAALKEALAADSKRFVREVLAPYMADVPWDFADHVWREAHNRLSKDLLWRHNPERAKGLYKRYRGSVDSIAGKRILDFGCGKSNPLALSSLFYVNGAAETFAVDLSPANEKASGESLFMLFRNALALPDGYKDEDVDWATFASRVHEFNLDALSRGDFQNGIGEAKCRYHVIGHEQYAGVMSDIDYVYSQSVLEHVFGLGDVLKSLRGVMKKGGIMAHQVDFHDHRRRYLGMDGINPWLFLTEDTEFARTHCNRIRYTEMSEIIEQSGFKIVVGKRSRRPFPPELREQLLPQFKDLSDIDLETLMAHFVLEAV